MTATTIPTPLSTRNRLWRISSVLGLILTAVLLAGLLTHPTRTLPILWDMVIPLLPAVFLINPVIWRNVCPLATLNAFTGKRVGQQMPDRVLLERAWVGGIALLAVMVPARRFLFNESGTALFVTITAVATLALLLGTVFSRRSGFCNALCPVLPVEKLYGQAPLLRVRTARCIDCNQCSPIGCLELAGGKSLPQSLGPTRRTTAWSWSPLGVFAGAFPGFIVGYFTTENGPISSAPAIYGHIGIWSLGSLVAVLALVKLFNLSWRVTLPVLGGIAVELYYWFVAPTLAKAYGLPEAGTTVLRVATLGLVVAWLTRALIGRISADHRPAL